jgi:hypothetical protein
MSLSFIKNCNASGGISSPRALVQFGPLLFYPEFPFLSVRVLSVRGAIPFFPYGIAIASANLARPSLLSRTVLQVVVSSPRALVQFGLLLFYPEFPFLSVRGAIPFFPYEALSFFPHPFHASCSFSTPVRASFSPVPTFVACLSI